MSGSKNPDAKAYEDALKNLTDAEKALANATKKALDAQTSMDDPAMQKNIQSNRTYIKLQKQLEDFKKRWENAKEAEDQREISVWENFIGETEFQIEEFKETYSKYRLAKKNLTTAETEISQAMEKIEECKSEIEKYSGLSREQSNVGNSTTSPGGGNSTSTANSGSLPGANTKPSVFSFKDALAKKSGGAKKPP
jgi:hypothetical protein